MEPTSQDFHELLLSAISAHGAARRKNRRELKIALAGVIHFAEKYKISKLRQLATIGFAMLDQMQWDNAGKIAVEILFEYLSLKSQTNLLLEGYK
jgi:hypothetical protein